MDMDLAAGHYAATRAAKQLLETLTGQVLMESHQIQAHIKDVIGGFVDQKIQLLCAAFDGDMSLVQPVAEALEEADVDHLDDLDLLFHRMMVERLKDKL